MKRTFVEKSEKILLKFKTKKDNLSRILYIFKGGGKVVMLIHRRYLFKSYHK
jgi:hypothetical protein